MIFQQEKIFLYIKLHDNENMFNLFSFSAILKFFII